MTVDLSQQLAALTTDQRRVLHERLRRLRAEPRTAAAAPPQREPGTGPAPGPAPDGRRTAPLSSAQERLWFLDRLDPGNPVYNIPFAVALSGPLDHPALRSALSTVVSRHDALRTHVEVVDDRPVQVVRDDAEVDLDVVDLRAEPDRAAALAREQAAHAGHRFDLTSGPLLAARLLVLDDTEHRLLVTVHHVVFDGWSIGVFIAALAEAYGADGQTAEPAPSFAEYARHEHTRWASDGFDAHIGYWRERLAGAPVLSTLPTDRPRPPVQTHHGAEHPFVLVPPQVEALAALARSAGATQNAVVLAAFAALVHQATGQPEVLLGVPVAARDDVALEGMIGCFANTVVLRIGVSGNLTGRDLVTRVHREIASAYRHQQVPLARVVEEVSPPRDPSRNPLFQCAISLNDVPMRPYEAAGVTFTAVDTDVAANDFDMFCTLERAGSELRGRFGYNADLYLAETVAADVDRFAGIIADLAAHPDRRLDASIARPRTAWIAGSFSTEDLRPVIEFWSGHLRLGLRPRFAPYGQVVQHLLSAPVADEPTVVLLRWADWIRHRHDADPAEAVDSGLDDLTEAVHAYRARTAAPLVIVVCPDPAPSDIAATADDRLARLAAEVDAVHPVFAADWAGRYGVVDVADPTADDLGHVPYTLEFFAVLGTLLTRALCRLDGRRWPDDGTRRPAMLGPERGAHLLATLHTGAGIAERAAEGLATAARAAAASGPIVAPRTPTERRLADLVGDLLRVPEVGVTADFFTLGGHSLLATHLLARVHGEFGRHVPLHAFFTHPTVEGLAGLLDAAGDEPADAGVTPAPRTGDLAPSATQRRIWTLARLHEDTSRHNTAFVARLIGVLDRTALVRAVDAIVRRHEVLRTTFADRAGQPVLVFHDDVDCWWPDADLAGSLIELVTEFVSTPYDLARGPLLRVRLVRTGPDDHHLLIGMHHIVCDNVSWRNFLTELATRYAAYRDGTDAGLPDLAVQYADYAAWQRDQFGTDAFAGRLAWWRERLSGAPTRLDLRGIRATTTAPGEHSTRIERSLPAALVSSLRGRCMAEGVPLFAGLLAGLARALHRGSGQDDMVLGLPTTGRDRPEFAGQLGYFADMLPLRLSLAGAASPVHLLRQVHRSTTEVYARQDVPLSTIMEAVRPRREPGRHPLFQWMVSFLDEAEPPLRLPGLAVSVEDPPPAGTDFDGFVDLSWRGDALVTTLEYRVELYPENVVERLLDDFVDTLHRLVDQPYAPLADSSVELSAEPAAGRPVVLAGPDADRLVDAVATVMARWELPVAPVATAASAFRVLLDPDGPFAALAEPVNVLLVRWADALPPDLGDRVRERGVRALERYAATLADALARYRAWSAAPLLLLVSPAAEGHRAWLGVFDRLTDGLTRRARAIGGVDVTVATGPDPAATLARRLWATCHLLPGLVVIDGADRHPADTSQLVRDQVRHGREVVLCAPTGGRWPAWPASVATVDTTPAGAINSLVATGRRPSDVLAVVAEGHADPIVARWPDLPLVVGAADPGDVWALDPPVDTGPAGEHRLPVPPDPVAATALPGPGHDPHPAPQGAAAPDTALSGPARALAEIWADLLKVDAVGAHDDFFDLGGDSMLAIQVVYRAMEAGIDLTPRDVVDHPTVAALVGLIAAAGGREEPAAAVELAGTVPLTGAQHWFMAQVAPATARPAHFNHPYYVRLLEPVEPAHVERAVALLADRHDALRLRLDHDADHDADGWRMRTADPADAVPYTLHDLSGLDSADQEPEMLALARAAQESLDLAGPLSRALHFRLGAGADRLLMVNHHLVTDGVSRGILLDELATMCRYLTDGRDPVLPPSTTPYRVWAAKLGEYAQSPTLRAELPFWLDQDDVAGLPVPPDDPSAPVRFGDLESVHVTLDDATTAGLRAVARSMRVGLPKLVLWALAGALGERSGHGECTLALTAHGREPVVDGVDVTRTVGWFQVFYPLRLPLPADPGDPAGITEVARQLGRVPNGGIGHGLLRYGNADAAVRDRLAALRPPRVSFNYTGHFAADSAEEGRDLFEVCTAPYGSEQDPTGRWPFLLDFVASVTGGRLRLEVVSSTAAYHRSTVRDLLDGWRHRLTSRHDGTEK